MGCLNVIIDSDIIFLLVSILRPHYFNLPKTALKWRIFISQEIEEEIEDPVSSSLKEELLKEGIWEVFSPSDHQQAKEIARKYKDLRKTIHKGEASCYATAYCAGLSVLSRDHEARGSFSTSADIPTGLPSAITASLPSVTAMFPSYGGITQTRTV